MENGSKNVIQRKCGEYKAHLESNVKLIEELWCHILEVS